MNLSITASAVLFILLTTSASIADMKLTREVRPIFYDPCKTVHFDDPKSCFPINVGGQPQEWSNCINGNIDQDAIGTFIDVSYLINHNHKEIVIGHFSSPWEVKTISVPRNSAGYIKILIRGYYFNNLMWAWTNHSVHGELHEKRVNYWIDYLWSYKADADGSIHLGRPIHHHDVQLGHRVITSESYPVDEQRIPPSKKKQLQVRFVTKRDKEEMSTSVSATLPIKGAEAGVSIGQPGDKLSASQNVVFLVELDTSSR